MPDANPPGDRVESINLDAIQAPKVISNEPDTQSKLELDDERRKLENVGLAQDITARRKYAFRVFLLALACNPPPQPPPPPPTNKPTTTTNKKKKHNKKKTKK